MTKKTISLALFSTLLAFSAACSTKESGADPAAKSVEAARAPAAEPPAPAPAPAPTPPAALVDIDLGNAGKAWQGYRVKGLAGAEVSDNGVGGVVINFSDNTMLQLTPASTHDVKAFKKMLASNHKSVTFAVDTPDELVFTTVSEFGDTAITGYGFAIVVGAGGKKAQCGSSYDDEATAKRMLEVCKSLAKA